MPHAQNQTIGFYLWTGIVLFDEQLHPIILWELDFFTVYIVPCIVPVTKINLGCCLDIQPCTFPIWICSVRTVLLWGFSFTFMHLFSLKQRQYYFKQLCNLIFKLPKHNTAFFFFCITLILALLCYQRTLSEYCIFYFILLLFFAWGDTKQKYWLPFLFLLASWILTPCPSL